MNAFDLWEALTDVEDDQLLQADEPYLVRKPRRPLLRGLVAACMALVLLTAGILGTTALNQDTTMRYTIRYRENRVTYLCKVNAYRVSPLPRLEPAYLPEGYVYDRESSMNENDLCLTYRNTLKPLDYMSFTYTRITGPDKTDFYNLPMGSYERYPVSVNGLPGQLYLYTDTRAGGQLIWLDEENHYLMQIHFPEEDPTGALAVANSIQPVS